MNVSRDLEYCSIVYQNLAGESTSVTSNSSSFKSGYKTGAYSDDCNLGLETRDDDCLKEDSHIVVLYLDVYVCGLIIR